MNPKFKKSQASLHPVPVQHDIVFNTTVISSPLVSLQEFAAGSVVWLKNSKRDTKKGDKTKPRWLGPYTISRVLGKGVFQLCNQKTGAPLKTAVNQCRLRICNQRPSDKVSSEKSDPKQPEGDHPTPGQQGMPRPGKRTEKPADEDPPPKRRKV
jgi:hypothetical protein